MGCVVASSILSIFVSGLNVSGYVILAPFIAAKSEVAWLLLVQGLANFGVLVPAGIAADKYGSERILWFGAALQSVSIVASMTSACFAVQLLGRVMSGASTGILFTAAMVLIMERFQDPKRAECIGIALGVGSLGNLVGPPMAGYSYGLAVKSGWQQTQALAFAPIGLALFILMSVLWQVPSRATAGPPLLATRDAAEDPELNSSSANADTSLLSKCCGVYNAAGAEAVIVGAVLSCMFASQSAMTCAASLNLKEHGLSASAIGWTMVPAVIVQVVLSGLSGSMAETPRARLVLMIAGPMLLAFSLVVVATLLTVSPSTMSPVVAVVTTVSSTAAAMSIVDAPSISLMGSIASAHGLGYGKAVTASELAVGIGIAFGPYIGVKVLQHWRFIDLVLVLAAAAALVGLAFAAYFGRRLRKC
mmetsp:Transcript_36024/g.99316  ORF Transcript_36024/g.99316 Transcript_36024/m.99316 type:complete len:419 (+) Transcript_36024:58-1314(+)